MRNCLLVTAVLLLVLQVLQILRMLSRLLGVGIDIVEISRIQAVASRRSYGKLACRILSDTEMQDWHSLTDPYRRDEFLTVR